MREILRERTKKIIAFFTSVYITLACGMSVYAGGIEGSKLVEGTKTMINDTIKALGILAPIVGTMLIIYFLIRRAAADEIDIKKWNSRIIVTIVSCVGTAIAAVMVGVIMAYYK